MEALALYSVAMLGFGLAVMCCWMLVVLIVLTVMRFNAWASRVERNIAYSRGRIR